MPGVPGVSGGPGRVGPGVGGAMVADTTKAAVSVASGHMGVPAPRPYVSRHDKRS
ncbi:hypothetical protein GCM10010252_69080 [Streptomyces aureoverticillatus]|nr:hypothetical protein GCM10010252_69080 [Streptomyces aureoverticillatus]